MVHFPRWMTVLVLLTSLLGIVYAAPNVLDRERVSGWAQAAPEWLPVKQVNLGLDLQGGSHLLLRVGWETLEGERLQAVVDGLRRALRTAGIGYTGLGVTDSAAVFTLRDPSRAGEINGILADIDTDVTAEVSDGGAVRVIFTEPALELLRDNAITQSIEIVRRRIDELGTNEPNIQRQGEERILVQLPGIDDPQRVKDLLGQTAKLTFQFVDENTPVRDALAGSLPPGSELMPASEEEAGPGAELHYVIRKNVIVGGESLIDSQPTFQDNQPVVSFRFDSLGGRKFGDATRDNVGRRFAIVLDGEVISAPVIRSFIPGGNGIISGSFTVQSATDLALLLRSGALPAPLTVLEERSVGPGLGADSIAAGQLASMVGLVVVIIFMILIYGLFGLMAAIALLVNLSLLIAFLSILQATLTLPGIAGIVLTVGMAVDANVLIFERIREEVRNGRSPISAIDAGYSRALTTIIDSNLTTLIAGVLLFALGSGPVKGFAVTLSLGIVSSMFAALMLTRLMVVLWLRRTRPAMLPI